MPNRTPEERWGMPASYDELRIRIADLGGSITEIMNQLADPAMREGKTDDEYEDWRARAKRARAAKTAEITWLKALRSQFEQQRQQLDREVREQRLQRQQEREQQLKDAGEFTTQEWLLVNLFIALARLYKVSGLTPSDIDIDILARAHLFLVEHNLLG